MAVRKPATEKFEFGYDPDRGRILVLKKGKVVAEAIAKRL